MAPTVFDWWSNQPTSITTTGTNENLTYPDRIDAFLKLLGALRRQLAGGRLVLVNGAWVVSYARAGGKPRVSHKSTNKITPDPWLFPPMADVPVYVGGSGLLVPQGDPWPWN